LFINIKTYFIYESYTKNYKKYIYNIYNTKSYYETKKKKKKKKIFYLTLSSSSYSPPLFPDNFLAMKLGIGAIKYVKITNNGKNLLKNFKWKINKKKKKNK